MKVECLKKQIDINKIHWGIDVFKAEHYGNKPSYIIMNYETRVNLIDNLYYEVMIKDLIKIANKTDMIFGIPVALSEGLKYGEVDIV